MRLRFESKTAANQTVLAIRERRPNRLLAPRSERPAFLVGKKSGFVLSRNGASLFQFVQIQCTHQAAGSPVLSKISGSPIAYSFRLR